MIRAMASSTAGSASSNSSAQISESRSTPSISWVRSLLPIETPSMPSLAYVGIQYTTDGTSAITQRGRPRGGRVRPAMSSRQRLELPGGAHERDHEVQVRRLGAHPAEHVELEVEQLGFVHVAEAAAVADHRVLFVRLERARRPRGARNSLVRKSMLR